MTVTYNPVMAFEVAWYHEHGQHPERIIKGSSGQPYVIGDFGWNRNGRPEEYIEKLIPYSRMEKT